MTEAETIQMELFKLSGASEVLKALEAEMGKSDTLTSFIQGTANKYIDLYFQLEALQD